MKSNLIRKRAEKWMGKHKKTDIRYDIRLFDNRQYSVKFKMKAPSDIISKLAEWMLKRQGVNEKIEMSSFNVDERLHGKALKGFRVAVNDVERQVKNDVHGFKFVTFVVDEFKYDKIDEKNYLVKLKLIGDYVILDP